MGPMSPTELEERSAAATPQAMDFPVRLAEEISVPHSSVCVCVCVCVCVSAVFPVSIADDRPICHSRGVLLSPFVCDRPVVPPSAVLSFGHV
jgi:hypothetical protein